MKDNNEKSEQINYEQLLCKNIDDIEIKNILVTYPDYKIKEIKNYTYINLYSEALSLCFCDTKLQQVYFYNEGVQGFKKFTLKLPYNLNFNMVSKSVVEYLGDTEKKGGGSGPIWLAYDRLGIEVTFLGKFWTDTENPITHFCIYQKEENNNCSTCLKEIKEMFGCSKKCNLVKYCSEVCQKTHLNFHLKYCN